MRIIKSVLIIHLSFICSYKKNEAYNVLDESKNFITAVDISKFPEISITKPKFKDLNGNQKEFTAILKENHINTIRLRLWVNPTDEHSGFNEVKQFSQALKMNGFKIWITLHYSDTWADPGNQEPPDTWQNLNFAALKDSLFDYTKKVVQEIKPDFIQIGNEINSGILHPFGNISSNHENFINLIKTGCLAVRENSAECKIILHFAGIQNASWFFNQLTTVDYDIIGLSYYPIWHGNSLNELQTKLQELSLIYRKDIMIAETAYPFTLEWNDWTNNIVGLNNQLILPDFPATINGQRKFIREIKNIVKRTNNGIGFCYWGAELIAWKGNQSTDASPWENQALFDFENKALPVFYEFRN
jgi:arabinogalactan endo-1,4-beta-galactosidase